MLECLNLDNPDIQEWIKKEGIVTTYSEYLNRGELPNYKDWTGKTVTTEQAKELLDIFLPIDNFKIDKLSNLMDSLPVNTAAAYLQQVLYLSENPQKADVYEEGFHAIMDTLVSEEEKKQVLKAGQYVLGNRLKKEGTTINNYVKELVAKYPTIYGKMSKEQALERAFEEEIASMFVDSFNNKNYLKEESELKKQLSPLFGDNAEMIAKILSKIFRFFKSLFSKYEQNRDTIDVFFSDIKAGKYKGKSVNGDGSTIPSTRLLELSIDEYDEDIEEEVSYTKGYTSEDTQRVVRNIGSIFFQLEAERVYPTVDERVRESIKLFFKLDKDFSNVDILSDSNTEAFNGLVEDVKEYVEVFSSIVDFESETAESEEETTNEFAKFDSSSNENSTFESSYSKQLKLRIGKTGRVKDVFYKEDTGLDFPIKLIESVNVLNVYYSFARSLGNTSSDKDRWNRLYAFSKLEGNPDAKAFVDTLLYDLFRDKVDGNLEFDTAVKKIKELYDSKTSGFLIFPEEGLETISSVNSSIINGILKGFDLWKRSEYVMTWDNTLKESALFDANLENVKKSQYNNWVANLQNKYEIKPANYESKSYSYAQANTVEKFNEYYQSIRNFFIDHNIQVSDAYLKYSLLANTLDVNSLIQDNSELASLYKDFKIPLSLTITPERWGYIKKGIIGYMETGNESFITGVVNGKKNLDLGIEGQLNSIAEGNGYFDERIPDNTFKSADGKTKYNYQNKTFFLQKINEILKNPTDRDVYRTKIGDGYLTEGQEFIDENYLFKNFSTKEWKSYFTNGDIKTFSANGLRQSDSIPGEKEKRESDGVSAGDMSTRDFSVYLLNTAVANKLGSSSMTGVYVGNFEASKTYEFVNLPFIEDLIDNKNGASDKAIDLIKEEFRKEYERIRKYSQTINTDNKFTKYNTGKLLKVEYDNEGNYFYLPYKESKGIRTVDFGNFRAMQFSDHVANLADDSAFTLSKEDIESLNTILNSTKEDVVSATVELSNNLISSALLNKEFEMDSEVIKTGLETISNNFVDYLNEQGVINNNENVLLDKIYENTNKKYGFKEGDLSGNIKKMILSNMFNTMFLNQLLHGDQALLYKNDQVDMFKRFKGRNAAINSFNTSTIAPDLGIEEEWNEMNVVVHSEIESKSGIDGENIDQADAQNYTTTKYMRYAMYSMGRLTKDHSQLLDYIEQGEDTTILESKIFNMSLFTPILKTVFFDGYTYLKKSDFMLSKRLTSTFKKLSEEDMSNLSSYGKEVNNRWRPVKGATKEVVKWSDGNYYEVIPRPDKAELHNRRKAMEGWRYTEATDSWTYTGNEIMLSMPISASKMLNVNTLKGHDLRSEELDKSVRKIDLKYYGLQLIQHYHNKQETYQLIQH